MKPLELTTQLVVDDGLILAGCQEGHADELFARIDGNRAHLRAWLPWQDHVQKVDDSLQFIQRQTQLRH